MGYGSLQSQHGAPVSFPVPWRICPCSSDTNLRVFAFSSAWKVIKTEEQRKFSEGSLGGTKALLQLMNMQVVEKVN